MMLGDNIGRRIAIGGSLLRRRYLEAMYELLGVRCWRPLLHLSLRARNVFSRILSHQKGVKGKEEEERRNKEDLENIKVTSAWLVERFSENGHASTLFQRASNEKKRIVYFLICCANISGAICEGAAVWGRPIPLERESRLWCC